MGSETPDPPYSPLTVEHFQHPRNVGRIPEPDRIGYLDDPPSETTISIYLRVVSGRIQRATFRTFGCSACIACSSIATELLVGLQCDPSPGLSAKDLDAALGGLPPGKRYCAELVAAAVHNAFEMPRQASDSPRTELDVSLIRAAQAAAAAAAAAALEP